MKNMVCFAAENRFKRGMLQYTGWSKNVSRYHCGCMFFSVVMATAQTFMTTVEYVN